MFVEIRHTCLTFGSIDRGAQEVMKRETHLRRHEVAMEVLRVESDVLVVPVHTLLKKDKATEKSVTRKASKQGSGSDRSLGWK